MEFDWEECQLLLANEKLDQLSRTLARPGASGPEKLKALQLLCGVAWSKNLIKALGPHKVSMVIQRATACQDTHQTAKKLRIEVHKLLHSPDYGLSSSSRAWMKIIEWAHLLNVAPVPNWDAVIAAVEDVLVFDPSQFPDIGREFLHLISVDQELSHLVVKLWEACKAYQTADVNRHSQPGSFPLSQIDISALADSISAKNAEASQIGRNLGELQTQMGLDPSEGDSTGPRNKLGKVSEHAGSVDDILSFAESGAQVNLLRA